MEPGKVTNGKRPDRIAIIATAIVFILFIVLQFFTSSAFFSAEKPHEMVNPVFKPWTVDYMR